MPGHLQFSLTKNLIRARLHLRVFISDVKFNEIEIDDRMPQIKSSVKWTCQTGHLERKPPDMQSRESFIIY